MVDNLGAFLLLTAYYAGFAGALGLLAKMLEVPHEVLRKLYHMSCGLSIFILLLAFSDWRSAVMAIIALLMMSYLLLLVGGRIPMASAHIDRGGGMVEIREHLLLMLLSMVILITVFWGAAGKEARYAVAAGFMAWGFGDASASLVGRTLARRRYVLALFDCKKSPLGSTAMAVTVFMSTFFILQAMADLSRGAVVLCAAAVGLTASLTEAVTRRGLDTLTVPLAAGFVCYPLAEWLRTAGGAAA